MEDTAFEPGLWGYAWQDCESVQTSVPATANLENNRIALDVLIGCLLSTDAMLVPDGQERPSSCDYLFGRTRDGKFQVLTDPRHQGSGWSSSSGLAHQSIGGMALMASSSPFDPKAKVESVELVSASLFYWTQEGPYEYESSPTGHFAGLSLTDELLGGQNPDPIYSDGDISVSLQMRHRVRFTLDPIPDLEFSPSLHIALSDAKPVAEVQALATRILSFFSFACGWDVGLDEMRLKLQGSATPVFYYASFHRPPAPANEQKASVVFPKRQLEPYIQDALGRWIHGPTSLQRATEMCGSLIGSRFDLPYSLYATTASQALELLSKTETDTKRWPDEEFKKRCQRAIAAVPDDLREWVEERLRSNQKGQKPLLTELLERHSTIANWLLPRPEAFITPETHLRNAAAHAGMSRGRPKTPEEIIYQAEAANLLSYMIIWHLLGVPESTVTERMERSSFQSYAVARARERFA